MPILIFKSRGRRPQPPTPQTRRFIQQPRQYTFNLRTHASDRSALPHRTALKTPRTMAFAHNASARHTARQPSSVSPLMTVASPCSTSTRTRLTGRRVPFTKFT